jgi:hypothetical protein
MRPVFFEETRVFQSKSAEITLCFAISIDFKLEVVDGIGGWGGPHEQNNPLFGALRVTTDSSGVMVCTADPQCAHPPCGNATTCQCQGWNYIQVGYCNASGCPMTSYWYCEVRVPACSLFCPTAETTWIAGVHIAFAPCVFLRPV